MFQAVKERASDIHIEPFERELSVRFRVDGILREKIKPPKRFQKAIASRVKAKPGSMAAADAEALAWSQPSPPARRPPAGRAIPAASVRWRAQPLSA